MSKVIVPPKSPDGPAMLSTEAVPGMGSVSLPGQLSMSGCSEGVKHMQEIQTIFLKQRRLRCHKEIMQGSSRAWYKFANSSEKRNKSRYTPQMSADHGMLTAIGDEPYATQQIHWRWEDIFYAKEESNIWSRVCLGSLRAFEMVITLQKGKKPTPDKGKQEHRSTTMSSINEEDREFVRFKKDVSCPVMPLKPCCRNEVVVLQPNGMLVGTVTETCWLCTPSFEARKKDSSVEFLLAQPTCLGGLFVDCFHGGALNLSQPFFVFPPVGPRNQDTKVGSIAKIFHHFFEDAAPCADKLEVEFPQGVSAETKTTLTAGSILINRLFYEGTPPELGDADYSLKGMPDSFDLLENTSKRKEWGVLEYSWHSISLSQHGKGRKKSGDRSRTTDNSQMPRMDDSQRDDTHHSQVHTELRELPSPLSPVDVACDVQAARALDRWMVRHAEGNVSG